MNNPKVPPIDATIPMIVVNHYLSILFQGIFDRIHDGIVLFQQDIFPYLFPIVSQIDLYFYPCHIFNTLPSAQ